LTRLILA